MEDTPEFKATLLSWKTLQMQVPSFEGKGWKGVGTDLAKLICQV